MNKLQIQAAGNAQRIPALAEKSLLHEEITHNEKLSIPRPYNGTVAAAPGFAQKVAELTPCRRAARRAALFSPSQRGRRERSERGGRFGDLLCKAGSAI